MFNFTNLTYRGAAALALTLIQHTSQASAAETCVAAPTCAELGYTLTSTANCVGTPLKCPFDTTKYNCTQKSDAIVAMMPDYKKGRSLAFKTNHYMTENGWINAGAAVNANDGKTLWYINDERVGTAHETGDENSALYPVVKGDKVYHNGLATYNYLTFYPCRGN